MKIPDGWIFEVKPKLASVDLEGKELIKCKHCKYYVDDVINFGNDYQGRPIIVERSTCKKWGNGCETIPDGYCFMAEEEETE